MKGKKIIYICRDEEDAMHLEKTDENIICIFIDINKIKSLTAFISRATEVKDKNYLILDVRGTNFSSEHILSFVQMLRQFSVAELIVIANDTEDNKILFAKISSFDIKHLILEDNDVSFKLQESLTPQKSKNIIDNISKIRTDGILAQTMKDVDTSIKINPDTFLNIVVVGACGRIGATTQAIGIYHYIKKLGFNPIVIDKTSKTIETYYNYDRANVVEGEYLYIHDIPFNINSISSDGINVNIFDIGNNISKHMTEILSADLVVTVLGVKPIEVYNAANLMGELQLIEDRRLINIISFADDTDFSAISENLKGTCIQATYNPNMFNPNNDCYHNDLYKIIKGIGDD